MTGMMIVGFFFSGNTRFLDEGSPFKWLYYYLYSPMQATMFSLLAFFIASAAFRAFRIRTIDAALLAVAALIVMVGRVPIGNLITSGLPTEWQGSTPSPTGRRKSSVPVIEIGRAPTKAAVYEGLERWKARHQEAAAHLEPADVIETAMRGRAYAWYRLRSRRSARRRAT